MTETAPCPTAFGVDDALDAYEHFCPNVIGNPFIPHFPHPKQAHLLGAHLQHDYARKPIFECLFGGAAGGGKSDALLMAAAQYAWKYSHFRGVLLRRTHTELMKAGALISRAMQWWPGQGVAWDGSNKIFRFPNGSTVEMGYHATEADNGRYQGGEWHFVGFDELTHWPDPNAWEWLMSRIRKNVGDPIPLRCIGASNPGSVGHVWVKGRFIGGIDMETGQYVEPNAPFFASRIDDNPSLDREAYKITLQHMNPTMRDQLLEGNWDAREPGDYYRVEWFGPLCEHPLPHDQSIAVRWYDLAASEKKDAARTAGVLMTRHARGVRMIEHATAYRATSGKRDAKILQQAQIDGHRVVVGLEIEGGSGGQAQFDTLAAMLKKHGFRVAGARPKAELTNREGGLLIRNPVSDGAKAKRSEPVSSCLERGYQKRGECPDTGQHAWWGTFLGLEVTEQTDGLRLLSGPWVQGYVDEVSGFPETTLKDLADATAGAWAYLEAHPFGMSVPHTQQHARAVAEQQNVHPEERENPGLGFASPIAIPKKRKLWTP